MTTKEVPSNISNNNENIDMNCESMVDKSLTKFTSPPTQHVNKVDKVAFYN